MKILKVKNQLQFLLILLFFLILPSSAFASPDWSDTSGVTPARLSDLNAVFGYVLDVLLTLAGIALLIMIVIGGFQYLTAGDNPKNAEKATHTLTQAVTGLIIIIAAWFILQAIKALTGFDVTIFNIVAPN